MSCETHQKLMAIADQVDLRYQDAQAAIATLLKAAQSNPILKATLCAERFYSPNAAAAAGKALVDAVADECATATMRPDLPDQFAHLIHQVREGWDKPNPARRAMEYALLRSPVEKIRALTQRQLRMRVRGALWLRNENHSSPRLERAGWVIRMTGGHDTYLRSSGPKASSATLQTLATAIPAVLELVCSGPDELAVELAAFKSALDQWDSAGMPATRKIVEGYRRIGFRLFKDKAEIILSEADAEVLQVEMAQVMEEMA